MSAPTEIEIFADLLLIREIQGTDVVVDGLENAMGNVESVGENVTRCGADTIVLFKKGNKFIFGATTYYVVPQEYVYFSYTIPTPP